MIRDGRAWKGNTHLEEELSHARARVASSGVSAARGELPQSEPMPTCWGGAEGPSEGLPRRRGRRT
jgi:hypothetical protein